MWRHCNGICRTNQHTCGPNIHCDLILQFMCHEHVRDGIRTRYVYPWWRHRMETFSALLAICATNSPLTGEFPAQRPVTRRFDVFFDLCLNEGVSKQSWGWWIETSSRPLWRHINTYLHTYMLVVVNFDALAQASDIRIERRRVVFLCWMQDSKPRSQTPIRQQTECLLTNQLSYRGSS